VFNWPHLELTDFEKESVAKYARDKGKPGVLKRVYRVGTFSPTARPEIDQPSPKFLDTVQVSRRSRVFGLVFSGNLGSWYIRIQDAAGELLTAQNFQELEVTAPGQVINPPPGCLVSSMFPGTVADADSWLGAGFPGAQNQNWPLQQVGPLVIEPNWVLYPNTTLQFEATIANAWQIVIDNPADFPIDPETRTTGALAQKLSLECAVHVWEFPGMTGKPRKGKRQ
jgi:hypothetical protein